MKKYLSIIMSVSLAAFPIAVVSCDSVNDTSDVNTNDTSDVNTNDTSDVNTNDTSDVNTNDTSDVNTNDTSDVNTNTPKSKSYLKNLTAVEYNSNLVIDNEVTNPEYWSIMLDLGDLFDSEYKYFSVLANIDGANVIGGAAIISDEEIYVDNDDVVYEVLVYKAGTKTVDEARADYLKALDLMIDVEMQYEDLAMTKHYTEATEILKNGLADISTQLGALNYGKTITDLGLENQPLDVYHMVLSLDALQTYKDLRPKFDSDLTPDVKRDLVLKLNKNIAEQSVLLVSKNIKIINS